MDTQDNVAVLLVKRIVMVNLSLDLAIIVKEIHPPSRRDSYLKRMGCLSEILIRTPKMYQDLWAWLEMFLTPRSLGGIAGVFTCEFGRHLGFGNCGGLGRQNISRGRRR